MERNRKERLFHRARREIIFSPRKRFFFSLQTGGRENGVSRFIRSLARSVTMASKKSRTIHEDAREKVFFLRWIFPRRFSFFFFALVSFFPTFLTIARVLVLPSDFYIYISLKNKVRMNAEIGCIGEVSMNFIMHIYICAELLYIIYCIILILISI